MIYTRCGAPVQLITAEEREVEMPRGHYLHNGDEPGVKDMAMVWFCKAKLTGTYPDGSGEVGEILFDGDWFQAGADLRADNGWGEIEDTCKEMEGIVHPNPLTAVFHK